MSCDECHNVFVVKMGRTTPCGTCPKPLLEPRNEWVWAVFMKMYSQARIAGMGGFIGFDYSALQFVLKVEEVPEELWSYITDKLELIAEIAKKYWNKKED